MDRIDRERRGVLLGSAALIAGMGVASGAVATPRQAIEADEEIALWPNTTPGDRGSAITPRIEEQSSDRNAPDRWLYGIARPRMIVRRPVRPNGAAVLLVPGGGYGFLSYDNEGTSQAEWLNARDITAFILLYRLPAEGWDARELVPLQDAQRAMRLIRARAGEFGVDPARVAVLGFSAGGHLAGSLALRHAERVYAPVDEADAQSARPDLAALVYPVVSMTEPFTHGGSRDNLLGADAPAAKRQAASLERRVTAAAPPTFLIHAGDDGLVPVANSIALYSALQAVERPAELHLFDEGGHGFGVRLPRAMPAANWPDLFHAYGVRKGVFPAS